MSYCMKMLAVSEAAGESMRRMMAAICVDSLIPVFGGGGCGRRVSPHGPSVYEAKDKSTIFWPEF